MPIITISREMGTGAYGVAKELAKKLKYTLVDGPKLALVPLNMDSAGTLQAVDEKPPSYNTVRTGPAASINSIELILLDLAGRVTLFSMAAVARICCRVRQCPSFAVVVI